VAVAVAVHHFGVMELPDLLTLEHRMVQQQVQLELLGQAMVPVAVAVAVVTPVALVELVPTILGILGVKVVSLVGLSHRLAQLL
jgi:hypothetical protein